MNLRHVFAPVLAATLALAGCAASTADEAGDSAAAVSESTPITLENYKTHPKIVAIRSQVADIDSARFAPAEAAVGCDRTTTKFEDAHGQIRKLERQEGEGGFDARTTAYYNEAGQLLFVFQTNRWLEESAGAFYKGSDLRVYYAPDGTVLFQAVRVGQGPEQDQIDLSSAEDRAPTEDEAWLADLTDLTDPVAVFADHGCGDGAIIEPVEGDGDDGNGE